MIECTAEMNRYQASLEADLDAADELGRDLTKRWEEAKQQGDDWKVSPGANCWLGRAGECSLGAWNPTGVEAGLG